MEKITKLKLIEPKNQDEEVIAALRQLLLEAEFGRVSGLVVSVVYKNDEINYQLLGACADNPSLAMAIAVRLKAKITSLIIE